MCEILEKREKEGLLDRRVTIFGVKMRLKYWIAFFIFIAIGIFGFIMPFIFTPLEYDFLGFSVGIAGLILGTLSIITGAGREQVDDLTSIVISFRNEFREFRSEFREEITKLRSEFREEIRQLRQEIINELREFRKIFEKYLSEKT